MPKLTLIVLLLSAMVLSGCGIQLGEDYLCEDGGYKYYGLAIAKSDNGKGVFMLDDTRIINLKEAKRKCKKHTIEIPNYTVLSGYEHIKEQRPGYFH